MSRTWREPTSPAVDILVQSPLWQAAPDAELALRRAIAEAASMVSTTDGELAIVLADDSAIRALNRQWRGKDAPTNVLSFPATQPQPGAPVLLGDIMIAYQTALREADAENKLFMHHVIHLAVHGFLHLIGYDHETAEDAGTMERLESAILARLGVPDPYLLSEAET